MDNSGKGVQRILKTKRKKMIAVVYCQGGCRAKETLPRNMWAGDCTQVLTDHPEGVLACDWGCLGQGNCVTACRLKAIHIGNNNTAEVDRDKCVGCGLCVKACPKGLIQLVMPESTIMPRCSNREKAAASRTVCKVSCIACGICEKNCPADAIHVIENIAVIDDSKCIACGMCAMKCPRGVIRDADGIITI